jgi:hypothetical protein
MKSALKLAVAASTLLFSAALLAQESGVSRPEDLHDTITTAAVAAPAPEPRAYAPATIEKPAAGTPYSAGTAPAAVVPTPGTSQLHQRAYDPDAGIVIDPLVSHSDPTADERGIVTHVPSSPFELPEGTLIKADLNTTLSTGSTKVGSAFYARLTSDVLKDGKVILPAGAVLAGRVTSVHGGRRVGGAASIHLRPYTVSLPDGSMYNIEAQVIDSDLYHTVHISSEGTITRTDHVGATLSAIGLVTGSSAVAGALLAGPPGALIGAGVGAGVGTFVWLRQDHQQTLPEGTGIVFSLIAPMDIRPSAVVANQHAALTESPQPAE